MHCHMRIAPADAGEAQPHFRYSPSDRQSRVVFSWAKPTEAGVTIRET